MKEHLNLNPNVEFVHNPLTKGQSWGIKAGGIENLNESGSFGSMDKAQDLEYDVDLSEISSHLAFFRQQSTQTEGRKLMTAAHDSVSKAMVLNLFADA